MSSPPATPPPNAGILQIRQLTFSHAEQPPIARDWTASIPAGITLLHGDTGSGKSTLLRVLAGVLPASGELTLAGTHLAQDRAGYLRKVFFCDPASDAFDQVTARACTLALSQGDAGFDDARWHSLLDGFALTPHIDKPLYMLSTGSKRKVGLAAALASGRALTLLDEPVGALDAASLRCLWRTLAVVATQPGRAIVIASSEHLDQVALASVIALPIASDDQGSVCVSRNVSSTEDSANTKGVTAGVVRPDNKETPVTLAQAVRHDTQ